MSANPAPSNSRASAVSGIVFALTFAAAGILLGDLFGSFADSDETFVEYYESTSNRNGSALGGLLLFASGVALIPFASGVVRLLAKERPSQSVDLAAPLSYVASGLIIGSAAAFGTVGMARVFADITNESSMPFQGSSIVVLPQLGYVLFVFAAWVLAVVLAIVARAIMRSGSLPRWVAWLTIVCAALLLLAPSGIAIFVLPVWSLATSIAMLRRSAGG